MLEYMIYYADNEEKFIEILNNISDNDIIYLTKLEYFFNHTINIYKSDIRISSKNNNSVIFNFKNIPYISINYDRSKVSNYIANGNGVNVYGNNITLENIVIKFSAFRGLENFGNNNKFINIETAYNCDTGHSQKGENNLIKNCISHHNFDYRLIKDGELKFGFNSDGFSDKFHKGKGNIYVNCISYKNGDDGFTFFLRDTPKEFPTILNNCRAIDNGPKSFDMLLNERFIEDTDNKFKLVFNTKNWPNYGEAHGFKLGGVHKTVKDTYINYHYIKLYNCTAINNKHTGFTNNHNNAEIYLINCISENNYRNYYLIDLCSIHILNCKSNPINNIIINKKVNIIEDIENNFKIILNK